MSIEDSTVLGRLLEELSWEAHDRIKTAYCAGGRGLENVLAAEVLMPLDFLPRNHFLGEVLLATRLTPDKHAFEVQPDAQLISDRCHVLVEAKRIRQAKSQAAA